MTRHFNRFLFAPLFLILALFVGCENIPKDLAGLEVDIVGVRSFTPTDTGGEMVVTVRCRNETVRPIGIREVRLNLKINDINVGKGVSSKPIATQALSTNTSDVTFAIKDSSIAQQLEASFAQGSVNYDIKTQLMIMSGGQLLHSKSSSSGNVSVSVSNLR
ncbi:MAG: LEA type 2 family protein [Opitutaceae bacterium]